MADGFRVRDEPVDGRTHAVVVEGEIDLFTAPEFKRHVGAAIDSGADVVLVDLAATTFMDSTGLGVLIGAHRRLGLRDGRLVLVTDVEPVRTTLRITGLDAVLEVAPSRAAALAA